MHSNNCACFQCVKLTLNASRPGESRDGTGAADHDMPYAGFKRSMFNTRQLARLTVLRSWPTIQSDRSEALGHAVDIV